MRRRLLLIEAFLSGFLLSAWKSYGQWHEDRTFDRMMATPPGKRVSNTDPGSAKHRIWHLWL